VRRNVLFGLAALAGAALLPTVPALAQSAAPAATIDVKAATAERVVGSPNAKITIIEYSSFTCPHCADFHEKTWPRLKADFVDTGQVRMIFRDYPLNGPALAAAMLARCVPAERYEGMSAAIFKSLRVWAANPDPIKGLQQIARLAGMSDATFQACLSNEELKQSVAQSRLTGTEKYKVASTPSFFFNEGKEKIEGAAPYEDFVKVLEKLGAKKPPAK